jgi:hypothetical protein
VKTNVFTLYLDHGPHPRDAAYNYSVYPAATPSQTAQYAANPELRILANTQELQAVYHDRLKLLAATFWQPGRIEYAAGRTCRSRRSVRRAPAIGEAFHLQSRKSRRDGDGAHRSTQICGRASRRRSGGIDG